MSEKKEAVCTSCGTTESYFKSTMLLGCPDCYKQLSAVVTPFIRETQHAEKHCGRVAYFPEPLEVSILKKEYYRAIDRKRFDDAERIAANIRALGGRL